jgi:hypothetical protein
MRRNLGFTATAPPKNSRRVAVDLKLLPAPTAAAAMPTKGDNAPRMLLLWADLPPPGGAFPEAFFPASAPVLAASLAFREEVISGSEPGGREGEGERSTAADNRGGGCEGGGPCSPAFGVAGGAQDARGCAEGRSGGSTENAAGERDCRGAQTQANARDCGLTGGEGDMLAALQVYEGGRGANADTKGGECDRGGGPSLPDCVLVSGDWDAAAASEHTDEREGACSPQPLRSAGDGELAQAPPPLPPGSRTRQQQSRVRPASADAAAGVWSGGSAPFRCSKLFQCAGCAKIDRRELAHVLTPALQPWRPPVPVCRPFSSVPTLSTAGARRVTAGPRPFTAEPRPFTAGLRLFTDDGHCSRAHYGREGERTRMRRGLPARSRPFTARPRLFTAELRFFTAGPCLFTASHPPSATFPRSAASDSVALSPSEQPSIASPCLRPLEGLQQQNCDKASVRREALQLDEQLSLAPSEVTVFNLPPSTTGQQQQKCDGAFPQSRSLPLNGQTSLASPRLWRPASARPAQQRFENALLLARSGNKATTLLCMQCASKRRGGDRALKV